VRGKWVSTWPRTDEEVDDTPSYVITGFMTPNQANDILLYSDAPGGGFITRFSEECD